MKNQQLRKHLKVTWKHRWRRFRLKRQLGFLGQDVFIDKNVELQRYPSNIHISEGVVLKEGSRICSCNQSAKISIGTNTTIGFHTFIFASDQITIGDNCLIAPFVYIVDSDHEIKKNELINEQPNISAAITIGNDVWIGAGAKILKGVTVADGAVIAAGAVVKADIGAYEIHGGVPAKKISERS